MSDGPTTEWCRNSFTMLKHPLPGRVCEYREAPKVMFNPFDTKLPSAPGVELYSRFVLGGQCDRRVLEEILKLD